MKILIIVIVSIAVKDFAGAIAYLASEASKYVTGKYLIVYRGFSSW